MLKKYFYKSTAYGNRKTRNIFTGDLLVRNIYIHRVNSNHRIEGAVVSIFLASGNWFMVYQLNLEHLRNSLGNIEHTSKFGPALAMDNRKQYLS